MCTIGRTSGKSAGKAHHYPDESNCTAWSEQKREDYGAFGCRNPFLNTVFAPLASQSLFVDGYVGDKCERINVITQENYEFLRDSYIRYGELMQKEAKHTPGHSIGESIAKLYDEMEDLMEEGLHVNIEHNNGLLHFTLWKTHCWGSHTLYYFPVKFLETLNPTLKKIAITFIHKFMRANGISIFLDDDESEFLLDMLTEGDDDGSEEWKKRMALVNSYQEGKINRLLKRVDKKSYYKDLPKVLDTYESQNGFERSLIDIMKKGLPFLTPERSIMQYGYDAFYSEDCDFPPMYLERQIMIVYDTDDIVTECLTDNYNCYSRETYDIVPITTYDLSPDTDRLFHMDDYPERFFRWADKFIYLTS